MDTFCFFMFRVCHAFLSVHCSLVSNWPLAVLCVMLLCVCITFQCGVLGQMWYLTVSIPDVCLFTYFNIEPPYLEQLIIISQIYQLEVIRLNTDLDQAYIK